VSKSKQSWGCVLLSFLRWLFECGCNASENPPRIRWNVAISGKRKVSGEFLMIQIVENEYFVTNPLDVKSAKGNPASVEAGSVVFSSSDPAVLAVTDNGDGTCRADAVGPVGNAQLIVTADADLGEGVVPITGTLDVTVVAGMAAVINVTAGVPQAQ
jgi:hypothetical protein